MNTNNKLKSLAKKIEAKQPIKIAIAGLGSVGNYLLNFLMDADFTELPFEIILIGRNKEKLQSDLNISRVAAGLRRKRYIEAQIFEADFNNIEQLSDIIFASKPDFIVNSSRAYSNLKYGSLSWNTIRAYGIWSPLSVKYIKNIMQAVEMSGIAPLVINTSYSDAVNAWIKTAGGQYPDFGSGNLNHLIPRIRMAVANEYGIRDIDNIEIILATSHFHDVVISKEGQTERVEPLITVRHNGKIIAGSDGAYDMSKIYKQCAIPMPTDAKRNMMNASSNFDIIATILKVLATKSKQTLHIPGAMGMIGGYPVDIIDENLSVNQDYFTLKQMQEANLHSIYLDGIENVENGILYYTEELLAKTQKYFGYKLPKQVKLSDSNIVAEEIIKNIIEKEK
jgi:hypothetical protein